MIAVLAALLISLSPATPAMFTMSPAPADPTPGIQPPGPNGQAPQQVWLPPVCSQYMPACGYHYSPDDGTWHPSR